MIVHWLAGGFIGRVNYFKVRSDIQAVSAPLLHSQRPPSPFSGRIAIALPSSLVCEPRPRRGRQFAGVQRKR